MNHPTTELFLDEIDAIEVEFRFGFNLDTGQSPFRAESHPHIGEGGATTPYYQGGKLVGFSSRVRDDGNRTMLLCFDLRSGSNREMD